MQLHQIAALALQRLGTQNHIELLAFDGLGGRLLQLVGRQVDQQVGHHQHGIIVILTDGNGDRGAVLAVNHTVDGQGNGDPLVLLDTAVVMGLEIGDPGILIQGIGLQVHPGGVNVGGADVGTLVQALFTDDSQDQGFVPVVVVDLVTGVKRHTGDQGLEAVGFSGGNGPCDSLPLGFGSVDKGGIALAIAFHLGALLGCEFGVAVLGSGKQGFLQFFNGHSRMFSFFVFFCPPLYRKT